MKRSFLFAAAAIAAVCLCQSSQAAIFGNRSRSHVVVRQQVIVARPHVVAVPAVIAAPIYATPAAVLAPTVVAPACNQFFVK
jgi:hypothetical protein